MEKINLKINYLDIKKLIKTFRLKFKEKLFCNYCGSLLKSSFICPSCKIDNKEDYEKYIIISKGENKYGSKHEIKSKGKYIEKNGYLIKNKENDV